ncbi:glutaminase A [Maritimibacter sp. UBA3975]|uniref:glutaminase A n=1 Tax=Maritimibacter sp. UBA3975 TaxID=1946833 RepID=UPI000C092F1A|nr:glutaminase A [Maritimibacter sp. UBA3975]MAM62316.1 glutaminase A [Maritimibacter sp.]|tara:strand:- start:7249 stop:9081 length:1833 start_codon:yes stop_codon:yes gene_type:complete
MQKLQIVTDYLERLHAEIARNDSGEVATYIPELGRADPDTFGIALVTLDGQVYTVGDWDHAVTIQSVSKPFMYGAALAAHGRERLARRVGVEPTGEEFNSIVLDEKTNRPFNPMVNAGAIATSELMTTGDREAAAERMVETFSRFAGRQLSIDMDVFKSEHDTGHRNRAIANMMLNTAMIQQDPGDVLDLYFKQCSVLVNCRDLAVMTATLAAHGRNPLTRDTVVSPENVRDMLSVMASCGMYDYAGQWGYDVGMPAKSGVSGLIGGVVPGQLGLAVYSPRLDEVGNSVRGIQVFRRFAEDFGLHVYSESTDLRSVVRRHYRASEVQSRHVREEREVEVLREKGSAFAVMHLQGPLFFGAMERVVRRIDALVQDGVTEVALDFRRVALIDRGGLALFEQLMTALQDTGVTLLLAEMAHRDALRELLNLVMTWPDAPARIVPDVDSAMEAFEDSVLAEAGVKSDTQKLSLSSHEIFAGLTAEESRALEQVAGTLSFASGDVMLKAGDKAHAFLTIAKGTVSVTVGVGAGRTRRVASIGPGQAIGEMALLDGGKRSANVVADGPVLAYVFAVSAIRDLLPEHPRIMEKILGNMVLSLSQRLRRTNDEVSALE